MSQVHKSNFKLLEVVLDYLGRAELHLREGDDSMSPRNERFIRDLYSVMAAIWIDVSLASSLVNKRWATYLVGKPALFVKKALKAVDYRLISEADSQFASFKHWLKGEYGEWGCQFFAPLFENIREFFEDPRNLQRLRTALCFSTRANLPDADITQMEEMVDSWVERAERVTEVVDLSAECAEVRRIFPRSKAWYLCAQGEFIGQFGPGQNAHMREAANLIEKYTHCHTDALLDYLGYKLQHPVSGLPRPVGRDPWQNRYGIVTFAPKELDKLRVISQMPPLLMYYQRGGQEWIMNLIRQSPWRAHIDLKRADLNASLAESGSLGGGFSTIDLSAASDDVRDWMVLHLTKDTCLRELVRCTRTFGLYYENRGRVYHPTTFAPMGDALCFPVECIVFGSVVSAIMRHHRDLRAWRVYGDDIIVPDDRYEEVVTRLANLGFTVNQDKSFTGTKCFRESCGGDYFSGIPVRPVYVSRFWTGFPSKDEAPSENALTLGKCVALANELMPYKLARVFVIAALRKYYPHVLFCDDPDVGLYSPNPTNFHLVKRDLGVGQAVETLQRVEYRAQTCVRKQPVSPEEYDDIRLYEWLRLAAFNPERELSEGCLNLVPKSRPVVKYGWHSPAPGWAEEQK